jgi:cytochrome c
MSDAVPRSLVVALSSVAALMMFLAAVAAENDQRTVGAKAAYSHYCQDCHSMEKGANRSGPSLHQIIGKNAGAEPNYKYSKAMKEAGFVWDELALDRYMGNPREFLPGSAKAAFAGVSSLEDRKKIVAYLQGRGTDQSSQ